MNVRTRLQVVLLGLLLDWTPVCQAAFERVKALLTCSPVLATLQLSRPFKLHVDASQVGAGAVLLQEDE